jgi:hypothetical protein
LRGRRDIGLPPEPGVVYFAFVDPSGGVSDSMTLAIGHLGAGDMLILDVVYEARPPFNPEQAAAECAVLCRRYDVTRVVGDRYGGGWPVARFREHGIEYEQSARPKSDLYVDLLSLINGGRIELLDLPRLSAQLCGLERRTSRQGKDSVDHAPGGHDDLANAVAGCLVQLDLDRLPLLVRVQDVTGAEGEGVAAPWCEVAFMALFDEGPDIGVVFCGASRRNLNPNVRVDTKLYVLDADAVHFRAGLFDELGRRLRELMGGWRPIGVGVVAPERLVPSLARSGLRAMAWPPDFEPEDYLTFAADCIGSGGVRFCPLAVARMKTRTIGAALELKAGDKVESALRAAFIAAIWVQHSSGREAAA